MICVSIAQESRRFALVDMFNAAARADLVELRLDRFGKAPDIGELLGNKPKPVIMSCRRKADGGDWQGTEEERLALLRQCIVNKADYVEIELDVADQIRKFPPAKRVITYTNVSETPRDIGTIYEEAQKKSPDVIKIVTLARTPEEAWPLVQILAKPDVPIVAVGLGKPGVTLAILGKKLGSPWTHAALERGMEAYPGQPTIDDLERVYHHRAIDRSTRLIGVTGFGETEFATVAVLNRAFAELKLPVRCLPLAVGKLDVFRKVIDAARLAGVVVDAQHRGPMLELASESDDAARACEGVDLIVHKDDKWHGHNTLWRAALRSLEVTLKEKSPSDNPLAGRMVMIVGPNSLARAVAYGIKQRGAMPIIASRDAGAAQMFAQSFQCRHVQFEAIYSTMHDVLVVCSDEREKLREKARSGETGIHSGYLKPSMTVMDLTSMHRKSALLLDAEARGCGVVAPRQLLLRQLDYQVRLITRKQVPRDVLGETLTRVAGED